MRILGYASLICLEQTDTLSDTRFCGHPRTRAYSIAVRVATLSTRRSLAVISERAGHELKNRHEVNPAARRRTGRWTRNRAILLATSLTVQYSLEAQPSTEQE